MVNLNLIAENLEIFNQAQPYEKKDPAEIAAMSLIWQTSLHDLTDSQFQDAFREGMGVWTSWPMPGHVRRALLTMNQRGQEYKARRLYRNREAKITRQELYMALAGLLIETGNAKQADDLDYLNGLTEDYMPTLTCLSLSMLKNGIREALARVPGFPTARDILVNAGRGLDHQMTPEYGRVMLRMIVGMFGGKSARDGKLRAAA